MSNTVVEQLAEFGQSIWLDNISRAMIESGSLKNLIDKGLRGMTSNPTIFEKAVSGSNDYNDKIRQLHEAGKSTFDIYDHLTVQDIQDAADMFKSLYERTNRLDGYVSLEVNPKLAYDREATIQEGKRLHQKVNRPNVMFKIPATEEGFGAIETLVGEGINVNVTLIFSLQQYEKTAEAFIAGMKTQADKGKDMTQTASVASVFISRIDTAVDKMLETAIEKITDETTKTELQSLLGKAAVANSQLIYKKHLDIFSQDRFTTLKEKGSQIQRVLWGSTGTKNPAYSDIKYVTELIGKNTVNTIPDKTLDAVMDHGIVKESLTADETAAQAVMAGLKKHDIQIDNICAKLLKDGAESFTQSFDSLLSTLKKRAGEM